MDNVQMITIIISVLIPMISGFAWIIIRMDNKFEKLENAMHDIDKRVTILETRLGFIERLLEFFSRKNNLDFKEKDING